jgi:hypothetical protein
MTTLIIKDLFLDEELDGIAIADVRGGMRGQTYSLQDMEQDLNINYCADSSIGICAQL